MPPIRFNKVQGLGNDFLIICDRTDAITADVAVHLCDRHLGVGADGVLLTGLEDGRPFMRVRNADGSAPEMCGNGLRCVASFLRRSGVVTTDRFVIQTDAGPHQVRVLPGSLVQIDMRPASLLPEHIPLIAPSAWIDQPIEVSGHAARVTAVSMGNPHAVLFDASPRELIGPALERDPRFPEGVNVGFARMNSDALELSVWERGVGWTRACGTGACAAAVAAVETGRARRGRPIEVRLPGGTLVIEVNGLTAPISMTGPAVHVFTGSIEL